MWHPHRALLYSESYRCKHVPRNTDVTLTGLCYTVNHPDDMCQEILM